MKIYALLTLHEVRPFSSLLRSRRSLFLLVKLEADLSLVSAFSSFSFPSFSLFSFRLDGELEPVSPIQQQPPKLSRIRTLVRSSKTGTEKLAKTWNSVDSEDDRRRTRSLLDRLFISVRICLLYSFVSLSLYDHLSSLYLRTSSALSLSLPSCFFFFIRRSFLLCDYTLSHTRTLHSSFFFSHLPFSTRTLSLHSLFASFLFEHTLRVSTPHVLRCFFALASTLYSFLAFSEKRHHSRSSTFRPLKLQQSRDASERESFLRGTTP